MTALLAADSVSFEVGRTRLLGGVSLDAGAGDLLAVVGPNGAGKSTLLRVLAGEAKPSAGAVCIEGRPIAGMKAIEQARLRAVLPQQTPGTFRFTAREVVSFARTPWLRTPESGEDEDAIEEAMRLTGVTSMAARAFPTLSGGEQTLVSLARVFAQRTPLLLLDEPTSALDLAHQALVMDLLREMADAGRGVVVVLHDLNLAAAYATRVLLLRGGCEVASGLPAEVLTRELIGDAFGHPVRVMSDPATGNPLVVPERDARAGTG